MSKIYNEQQYMVRTNDFDCNDIMRPDAVLDYFQEMAGVSATASGVGFLDLKQKGYYWILMRVYFEHYGNPNPEAPIMVASWPHPKGRIDFTRDYLIKDLDGNILYKGQSLWVVIDINTRRIVRTDNINYNGEHVDMKNFADPIPKLEYEVPLLYSKYDHVVVNADLDHNKHMNNSKYAEIIFNTLDLNKKTVIKNFEIQYINEAKLSDTISTYYFKEDGYNIYIGKINDKKCFIAKLLLEE